MRDYGPALRRLDLIASELSRERVSLHVCGGLSRTRTLDALFRLECISTLSLAFAGRVEKENRSLLESHTWEEREMLLGAGCIDVQVSQVKDIMDPMAVAALLQEVTSRIGSERISFVLPDCGMRATPRDLIPTLLGNLRSGFEEAFQ